VRRPRLLPRLHSGAALTVVRAPLGFGKTTLVAQWLTPTPESAEQRLKAPATLTGWLHLSSDCTTGTRFWPAAWQALRDGGLPAEAETAHHSPTQRLRRVLRTAEAPALLVVDGFERIADSGVERDLLELLRDCPQLRVVVCVRGNRHFHRFASPDLDRHEISGADLLFTAEETSELLVELDVAATPQRVAAIHAETGGWPELTRIVGQALARDAPAGDCDTDVAVIAAVAGDYLRSRILPEADDSAQRALMLASSVADELSAPLLEALLDGEPTQHSLPSLEAAGLLSLVDHATGGADGGAVPGYRWPQAARRALLDELRRRDPAREIELNARAARWYQDNDQPGRALGHAVAAQDWGNAVRIIDSDWRVLFRQQMEALYRAIKQIPLDVLATSVRALAVRDMWMQSPDDLLLAAMPQLPEDPSEIEALAGGPGAFDLIDTANIILVCLRHRGLHDEGLAYGQRAEAILHAARRKLAPRIEHAACSTVMQLGISRMFAGDLAGGRCSFQEAYDLSTLDPHDAYVRRDSAGKVALCYALAGDARQAAHWLQRHDAAAQTTTGEWFDYAVNSTGACARLLVALERFDINEATTALELDSPLEPSEFWAYFAYADAMYALHTGDPAAGLRALREHPRPRPGSVSSGRSSGPLLAGVEANLLMALGRGNDAHAIVNGEHAHHPYLRVARARLSLLAGQLDSAITHTRDLLWTEAVLPRWEQEMLLIQSVAHWRLGHRAAAGQALRRVLAAAAALDAWSVFATAPRDDLHAILRSLPVAEHLPHLDAVWLDRLDVTPEPFPRSISLVTLTPRERAILDNLAAGWTRSQLAQRLFISKNTVKFHIRSLYRKLGATTREEALNRATTLGLLPTATCQQTQDSTHV
jgi:LuxR family maltose regulon positive regulatory protein